jgi:hypothetical protein
MREHTFDHVTHQIMRVSSNVEELETRMLHKGPEGAVCRNPNAMTFSKELLSKG